MNTVFQSKNSLAVAQRKNFRELVDEIAKNFDMHKTFFELKSQAGSDVVVYAIKNWSILEFWDEKIHISFDSHQGAVAISFEIQLRSQNTLPVLEASGKSVYTVTFKEGTIFSSKLVQSIIAMIKAYLNNGTTGLADFFYIEKNTASNGILEKSATV